jgi:chitodextrinase
VASTDPCQDTQAPTAPTGIAAQSRTETSITLSWQASTDTGGVAGYRVYRDGALAGSTNSTSYTVAGLTCGKSYTFGLEAYDASGNHTAGPATIVSTVACSDTVAPSAPSSFVKTSATTTSIAVSWSPASDNVAVAGYSLFLAGSAIGTTGQSSYTFSGLPCGTSYALGIEAYDAAGNRSPRITLQADAAACASSPPTAPPSPPPSEVLANVFAVPPTSTDGSTNCVRSATPKTYEQALAASPKNVCAYVAGVKTSWDMACNAATAGDLVGVRPGVYETVGGGGYLLGSNEIGQDCSDGLGADVNPNAKEQAVSTGTTAAWVKFVPAVPCNGVPNISFKYMPGVLSMANGNWHLIVEGDCFNFNRTIYIHDRNDNLGPSGRPSNLIIRGESQTRLQQWYGIEVRGGRNMLFENIDQGPNVQCAANDANATPVYFRCLPPELGGAFFEAPYATSGTNAPGCNPNETDLCAGFFPRGGGEQVEPYIHGGAGYGTYSNIRLQTYHLHDGQAKGTGARVHPGCFMFDGNKGNGDLPPHNMVFDGVRCERQVIGVQHQDGGVTVQNSVFACPVVDLPQTTPQRGRWDQCAAQPSVGVSLRGDQPQTIMKNVLYRNNVFLPNPNVFNPTVNNAGLLLQLGGAFGTGFENVDIVGNIFYGANLQGCEFAGVTCADNAFLNAPSVGARPTTLTCNPFVDAEQGTPDDLWREKTQVDPRLGAGAACNVPTVSLVGDLNLDHDGDGDPRTNPTHVGADH